MPRETEKEILDQVAGFAGQVVSMVERLPEVVSLFAAGRREDLEKLVRELDVLESQADDMKEVILDRLASRDVFPMGRADLARLVGSMDGIANLATGAADRLSLRALALPADMNELLVEMAQVDVEAVRMLAAAVIAIRSDLRETMALANKVDKIESRADEVYARMYRHMFDLDVDFRDFHQLKAIIDRFESIADRCSQNAELLRHIALEFLERG